MSSTSPLRVALEEGKTWTFATAVDWPGWSRRAKTNAGADQAIEALLDYRQRYAAVLAYAGRARGTSPRALSGTVEVIGTVPGNATTDFGAPAVAGPWDDESLAPAELRRRITVLSACWDSFDEIVDGSAATLQKGPRGGGRDRDKIVDHVRDAERAYARKIGLKLPPRTPWAEQRDVLREALAAGPEDSWPLRYALNRVAWHVLDHAWEIEDKQP